MGSHRLGVAGAASDLDVVCAVEDGPGADVFLQNVSANLKSLGADVRDATDALVPIIKARLEGQSIDVQYARLPKGVDPSDLKKLPWDRLDEQSWRALVGCREADVMLSEAYGLTTPEAFRALLVWWRSWTATQQITGNAWCLPGSFSWAVAVIWALDQWVMKRKRPLTTDLRDMVAATFNMLSNRDSARPIGLTDEALQYKPRGQRDRWPVITSCAPCQNSARSVTASTAQLLDTTLRRASDLATRAARGDNAAWDALHTIQSPNVFTPHIQIRWDHDEARGWLEGHFTGLMVVLEQEHGPTLRPWPPHLSAGSAATNSMQIDLGAIPVHAASATARAWLIEEGAPAGVTILTAAQSTP